jgi:WD40 repeat protein
MLKLLKIVGWLMCLTFGLSLWVVAPHSRYCGSSNEGLVSVAFSADGQHIWISNSIGELEQWEVDGSQPIRTYHLPVFINNVSSVAISPDEQIALTGTYGPLAMLWDLRTGELLHTLQAHTDEVTSVAISPDSKTAITGILDGAAKLWDVSTGNLLHTLDHPAGVISVAFSPDGQTVLTGGAIYTTKLWDTQSGMLLQTFEGHRNSVSAVAFSPDGQKILTGDYNGMALLWDIRTGKILQTMKETSGIKSVAFAPDGATFLTSSTDNGPNVWDIKTGHYLYSVRHSKYDVEGSLSVGFSPDSQMILTGNSYYGIGKLWDARTGTFLYPLCPMLISEFWQLVGIGLTGLAVIVLPLQLFGSSGERDSSCQVRGLFCRVALFSGWIRVMILVIKL